MSECAAAAPGLRRLAPYWYEYKTRAKTRWYGRQILEVFTTEFRDRTKEYYVGDPSNTDLGHLQWYAFRFDHLQAFAQ